VSISRNSNSLYEHPMKESVFVSNQRMGMGIITN